MVRAQPPTTYELVRHQVSWREGGPQTLNVDKLERSNELIIVFAFVCISICIHE